MRDLRDSGLISNEEFHKKFEDLLSKKTAGSVLNSIYQIKYGLEDF